MPGGHKRVRLLAAGTAAWLAQPAFAAPQSASAQSSSTAVRGVDPATSSQVGLDDIVVTAQRRSESAQDVPITISAFDGDALQAGGLSGVEQVARLTPGLYVGKFDSLRPQVYLRGIGSRVFDPGSEGSVGIFTDESYVGRFSGSLADLLDVERVEVLKGPQGTLYGRNTIGGAINIITRRPTRSPEAYVEASAGNYGFYDVRGAVSGPLTDRVRIRLAGSAMHRTGYSRNTLTGRDGNGDDGKAVRLRIAADIGVDSSFDLITEYQEADMSGLLQESTGTRQFLQAPGSPSYTPTPDKYSDAYNTDGFNRRKLFSAIGRFDVNTDAVALTSITSFRRSRISSAYDVDGTPRDVWTYRYDELSHQFSQEVRLSSVPDGFLSFGERVSWVLGAYYYRERAKRTDLFNQGPDSLFHFNQPGIEENAYIVDIDTDSYAAFGQFTVSLVDGLRVTVGARYTHDEKDAIITTTTSSVVPPSYFTGFTVNPHKSWSSFDPKLTVDYRINPDILAYATISRGFKSGGFQFNATNATLAAVVFDPERVLTYEAGLKSQFLDDRVQLNVAAFYYDYKNLQLPRFTLLPPPAPAGSGSNIISNAAKSTIKGVEAALALAPLPGLRLNGGVSYLDARYDNYVAGAQDFSGNRMIRSPKWQANADIGYETALTPGLRIKAKGDWSYVSRIYFEADQGARPFTSQEGVHLFNARVGIGGADDSWSLDAWVRNIGDKRYVNTIFAVPVTILQVWSLPRTHGLSARYSF